MPPPASAEGRPIPGNRRKRASWTIVDQAISSASNAGLSIVVAREVGANAFGAFALAVVVYFALIAVSRSLITEPLMVRASAASGEYLRTAAKAATGLALALGAVAATVMLAIGLTVGGSFGLVLVALSVGLPGLLLQDACRFVFFTASRPFAAAIDDFVWAALMFGTIAALIAADVRSAAVFVLVWGVSGTLVGAIGLLQIRALPMAPRASLSWAGEARHLSVYIAGQTLLSVGGYTLALALVAAVGTLADAGALRAAQVLMGPVSVLFFSISAFAIPELVRRGQRDRRDQLRASAYLSATLAGVGVVWAALLLALPDSIGVQLLGDTWSRTSGVLLPIALMQIAVATAVGPLFLMRALGAVKPCFRAALVQGVLLVTLPLVGLLLWGRVGAGSGLAAAEAGAAVAFWWALSRELPKRSSHVPRPGRPRGPDGSPGGPEPFPSGRD